MNAGADPVLAEITQVCGDHDLELVDVLSRDGRGSRFVARVRTQDAVEAILKGCRPERPGERHALAAWQATGASARLLSDLGNGVLLIELLEGEPLGARLAQGEVDFVAIGDILRRLHEVRAVDGLQELGLQPEMVQDWPGLPAPARRRATAALAAILELQPLVTLHGDIGLLNVVLTPVGPKVWDPAGVRGPGVVDLAQLAVVVVGRTGRKVLPQLSQGYDGPPAGLLDALIVMCCLYYSMAVQRRDAAMELRLRPLVNDLDNLVARLS